MDPRVEQEYKYQFRLKWVLARGLNALFLGHLLILLPLVYIALGFAPARGGEPLALFASAGVVFAAAYFTEQMDDEGQKYPLARLMVTLLGFGYWGLFLLLYW